MFQAREEIDYLSAKATLTVARLLHLARQDDSVILSGSSAGAAEHAPDLFQINHARILEPKPGENALEPRREALAQHACD